VLHTSRECTSHSFSGYFFFFSESLDTRYLPMRPDTSILVEPLILGRIVFSQNHSALLDSTRSWSVALDSTSRVHHWSHMPDEMRGRDYRAWPTRYALPSPPKSSRSGETPGNATTIRARGHICVYTTVYKTAGRTCRATRRSRSRRPGVHPCPARRSGSDGGFES
jgi:hypothetical protein